VPASLAEGNRAPFLLVLHGFGGSGGALARHLELPRLADARGIAFAAPDGAPDASARRHWNAGPACCDFDRRGTDHVAALGALLDRARAHPRIDPDRIFIAGVSNGAFMAERLACDLPHIAGLLAIAGTMPKDRARCAQAPGVILHVHGDADPTVRWDGGVVLGRTDVAPHAGAFATGASWASRLGCGAAFAPRGTLDFEPSLPGPETEHLAWPSCRGRVELLRVRGGKHDVASSPSAFATLTAMLLGSPS
jgi:polyhydroxybutyrate depolymerase